MAVGPWLGWCVPRGFQPPRAGLRHVKASQAFTPALSKETSEVSCQGQRHKKFTGFSQPATYAAGCLRILGGSA
jgi:hypothetical protein